MAVYVDPETGIAYPSEEGGQPPLEEVGGVLGPDQPTGPVVSPPQTPDQRRATVIQEVIFPAYRSILGRDPNDAELAEAYDRYERGGGTDLRNWLTARAGTSTGSSGGGGQPSFDPGGSYDVPAFTETFTALERPDYLKGQYVAPQWTGGDFVAPDRPEALRSAFRAPSLEELEASPGYMAMLQATQRGLERSAAARGSVLSGGFIGRTLPRALNEASYAAYGDLYDRSLSTRQQQEGEFNRSVDDAFKAYQQKYGMFSEAAGRDFNARQLNESAFQADQTANTNQFMTRYNAYQDLVANRRNARNDYFSQNYDLARLGLDATTAGAPR